MTHSVQCCVCVSVSPADVGSWRKRELPRGNPELRDGTENVTTEHSSCTHWLFLLQASHLPKQFPFMLYF